MVQTLTLLGLPRLCHSSFALQRCDIGVHASFRASESTVLHLHVPPSALPSAHTAIASSNETNPVVALIYRGLLERKLNDYPGFGFYFPHLWNRNPRTENRAHLRGKQPGGGRMESKPESKTCCNTHHFCLRCSVCMPDPACSNRNAQQPLPKQDTPLHTLLPPGR